MRLAVLPLYKALWQYQPGAHDPSPPINLETPAILGAASGSIGFSGAATGTVSAASVVGAGAGALDVSGAATGAVYVAGAASGALGLSGSAAGLVTVVGAGAGAIDFAGTAAADAGLPPIRIIRADDAPDWRRRFYDRQLKEFEEALDEIVQADDPQEAAQEAAQAFEPLETASAAAKEASQAITEALRGLTMRALKRKELQREIASIREELALIEAYRRKKRNNEAALLLMM